MDTGLILEQFLEALQEASEISQEKTKVLDIPGKPMSFAKQAVIFRSDKTTIALMPVDIAN
jgi:hypothetical protein